MLYLNDIYDIIANTQLFVNSFCVYIYINFIFQLQCFVMVGMINDVKKRQAQSCPANGRYTVLSHK